MNEMFSLDNILKTNTADYCSQTGTPQEMYEAIRIQSDTLIGFRRKVPANAEVVVDYHAWNYKYSGTALIRKSEPTEKH